MLINNRDIEEFGATLLDYEIENSEIITYDDWLDGSFTPETHRQEFKFSYMNCEFLINQKSDDLAEVAMSNFLKHSSSAILDIECLSRKYKGVIESVEKEQITRGVYELIVKWKCEYSFEDESEVTLTDRTANIHVPGNMKTPAIVEITPTLNLIDLSIKGLGEDILLKNLTADKKIIIDGKKGEVTESGVNKYKDYDSWGFPYLNPGNNNVSINKDNINMKIRYKPRWI